MVQKPAKRILDTSIVYPIFLGTRAYKAYLASEFGNDRLYISPYVQMEFRRAYLRNVIDFYFTLRLPTIATVADALRLWSHKFQSRKLKAIDNLIAGLIEARKLDQHQPRDKEPVLRAVAQHIRIVEAKLRRQFTNIGANSTRCARAMPINLRIDSTGDNLRRFAEAFDDTKTCRSNCKIDHFLLTRYRVEVQAIMVRASSLPSNSKTRGVRRVAEQLQEVVEQGATSCSCQRCEAIGDAVIVLDAPRDMQLEDTDHSFNDLCEAVGQPHKQHPSEPALHNSAL